MHPFLFSVCPYGVVCYYSAADEVPRVDNWCTRQQDEDSERYYSSSRDEYDSPQQSPRHKMDGSFVTNADSPPLPPTYRLAPRKTKYRAVIEPAGTAPSVTNTGPVDETWEEVTMPKDEDLHALPHGPWASIMKVDDDDGKGGVGEKGPRKRKQQQDEDMKFIHLPADMSSKVNNDLVRTLTTQLGYMRMQQRACELQRDKDVIGKMIENLESALELAEDIGKFVKQLADGKTGVVEVHAERESKDVGKGRVGLDKAK